MGSKSRNKGGRVERLLVDTLKKRGWSDVMRIPLRGSYQKKEGSICKPDVIGYNPNTMRNVKFEVKARRDAFGSVYGILDAHNGARVEMMQREVGLGFIASYDLDKMFDTPAIHMLECPGKGVSAILRMYAWMGESDILAIKKDHKPFIYIRFYKV